ncbi:MAG: PAS domain-containing protein [Desulfobacterales bacterium]|nr:PAS domain-containing protein [Desulfobacterales bacterium]
MKKKISKEADWRIRVFDSLSFPTLILKPDRSIISANQIFLEKIGVDLDRIAGRTCREVFNQYVYDPGLPCSEEDCPLSNMIKDRKGRSLMRKFKTANGEDRWEDRVFSPILDDDGSVKYIIESVRDITRVKTLEGLYSGVRELMDKVVQNSVSAILAADRNGEIILINQAAKTLLGYTREEVKKIRVQDLYKPGVAREILEKLRDETVGEKGKLPITKTVVISKTGEEIPVEMTAAIIYEDGQEAATMGVFNDLREKLAAERQLREARVQVAQSQKMASLGRLAAGVAHEINNPLTGILLYGNMMLEKIGKDHPLEQNLNFVLEDAHRCKDIVKNLLSYSRQTSPLKETFRLNTLVEESLRLIRDQKLFMNVAVVKELTDDPVLIHADKNQLNQVVINLIMNALDAMDYNGTLTFRTRVDKEAGVAHLEIRDTGSGIPKERIPKIFDPFFTTKKPGKGAGLGLSTAYGIMKENNGRISLAETGPGGSTFLLELPPGAPSTTDLFESIG